MALVKTLTRVAVIGGLATGTAVLVAGPHRVSALFSQAHASIVTQIDNAIEDPIALRHQLRELESEYPKRIGDVRGELIEVRDQIAELEREQAIASQVVNLTSTELSQLQPMLERAALARGESPGAVIRVTFDNRTMPLEDAYAKAAKISNTQHAYRMRADQASQNMTFLSDQALRLGDLLTKLETERAELQSQLWLLNGEIEMIARNDKLIDMTERRQNAIERYERYDAVSLEQVTRRITKIRSEQEARLESLSDREGATDYEDRARTMLEAESAARTLYQKSTTTTFDRPETIDISNDDVDTSESEQVASLTIE